MRCVFLMLLFVFCSSASANEGWQPVTGIREPDIEEVIAREGVIYASSRRNLYRSEDNGEKWDTVFTARGDGNNINFITTSEQGIFVCTQDGLFVSANGKANWKRLFKGVGIEENNILHIAFSDKGEIYLGTRGGLFTSNDSGVTWQKDSDEAGNLAIRWIDFLDDIVFVAAEAGVYKKINSGWRRIFVTQTEESKYNSDLADAAKSAIRPVNSIFVKNDEVFLATDEGVFVSKDRGRSWNRFTLNGLLSQRVSRLLFKDNLYAVTDRGIFVFLADGAIWKSLYKGMSNDRANSIAVDSRGGMWVATNKGLYVEVSGNLKPAFYLSNAGFEEFEMFSHEPTIREVQNAAIEYAEVHPDKIRKWRQAANRKAMLPSVSIGVDRYVTDYWHWDAGQNPDVLLKGDDVISWDVTMTWDLGELIWNDDQTGIDTRSRLMVQLRDDILDEVTRTYFERRRLQLEMHISPPSNEKDRLEMALRIQELTADLDALTGGYFSEHSSHNSSHNLSLTQ